MHRLVPQSCKCPRRTAYIRKLSFRKTKPKRKCIWFIGILRPRICKNKTKKKGKGNKFYYCCWYTNPCPLFYFRLYFFKRQRKPPKISQTGLYPPFRSSFWLVSVAWTAGSPKKKVNFIRSWPGLRVKMWESRFLAKRFFFLSYHYALCSLRSPHEMKLPKKSNQVPLSSSTHIHIYVSISGHKYLCTWIELRWPAYNFKRRLQLLGFINKLLSHYCYYNFFIMLAACAREFVAVSILVAFF